MRFDDLARNLGWAALQYNCGRNLSAIDEDLHEIPASTSAVRVLAVLTAAWAIAGTGSCDALAGVHEERCVHQCGRVRYTRHWLAREAFGANGGSQRAQVTKALGELSSRKFGYLDERDRNIAPVLSLITADDDGADASQSRGVAVFAPALAESLLAGHMQRIPIELVRDLRGSAFRPWLYILMRVRASRTRKLGQWVEVAVTGRRASAQLALLGMQRLRTGRIAGSLKRYAEAGNRVQSEWRLEVLERRQGGVKLRLIRLKPRTQTHQRRRAA
jgi:hypothetical protein